MKKILIVFVAILALCGTSNAWDLYTYPIGKDPSAAGAPDMRAAVYFYFSQFAIKIAGAPETHWGSATAYAVNDVISVQANIDVLYQCTAAGTSGAAEPIWPTTVGDTVVDGGATWKCVERANQTAFANDILKWNVSQNQLSKAVSTNSTIAADITASDAGYVNDLAYVIMTQYESTRPNEPLFSIMAQSIYGN